MPAIAGLLGRMAVPALLGLFGYQVAKEAGQEVGQAVGSRAIPLLIVGAGLFIIWQTRGGR